MSSPSGSVLEGVLAVHKPTGITSAQVLRDLQEKHFDSSPLFAPLLASERAKRAADFQTKYTRRRDNKPLHVKLGHGGTLDPMATGVLIVGVGKGTKTLQSYLDCTKTYEAVVLFGASTDTYDITGKVVRRKDFDGITEAKVTEALKRFHGRIKQRPPIFSALRINGRRAYDIAREGGPVPEMKEREVTVESVEIVEWLGDSHDYATPDTELAHEEKQAVDMLNGASDGSSRGKRKRSEDIISPPPGSPKRNKPSARGPEGADLENTSTHNTDANNTTASEEQPDSLPNTHMSGALQPVAISSDVQSQEASTTTEPSKVRPPAARIRMTVSSGFYVRSLCHDLGEAVGSAGMMAALARTRQGEFELGRNVLEWEELSAGEDVWGPKVEAMLQEWLEKEKSAARAKG